MNILIVEDNDESRYMLESLLKGSGYDVISATNGVEAIERLKKERFDMIISDILMPKMDGFRLCRKCKSDDTLRKIPFVFYTATYTDKKDEEFALSLGAEKFIVKPVEPDKFLEILEAVIEEHEARTLAAPKRPVGDETVYLAEYNKRLIEKLEHKALNLEEELAERKRAEKALRRERDKAQRYLDVAGVMLVAIDTEQRVGLINKKGCDILGYKEEEILGKNWFDNFLPSRIKDETKAVFEKLIRAEVDAPEYRENPILTKSGDERLMAWNNTVLRDEKGRIIATLSSSEDITERKRADETLKDERKRLFALLDGLPAFVYLQAPDHSVRFANRYFREHFEDPKGRPCYEILWGAKKLCKPCPTFRVFDTKEPQVWEWSQSPDGRIYEVNDYPFTDVDGSPLVLELGIDITERKKAEEQITKLAKFPAENPNPVLRISGRGTVIYANMASASLLKIWDCRVGKSVMDRWHELVMDSLSSSQSQQTEVKCDGRIFSLTFAPVVKANYVNVYGHDITERRKAEEDIRNLAKFPSENPNAVFRVNKEGNILYANRAGQILSSCRKCFDNDKTVSKEWLKLITEAFTSKLEKAFEFECKNRFYSFIITPVAEGGYANFYGRDITERKKAEEKLLEHQAKLKTMASEMLLTEERERQRLAVGLHDEVCQKLVLTKLALESSLNLVSDSNVLESLRIACEGIGETIEQADSLTFELSNPVLREFGFVVALEKYLTEEIRQKHGIEYELQSDEQLSTFPDEIKNCLFRVTRELLTNVVKHAQACKVKVSVRESQSQIYVRVQDDGVGFEESQAGSKVSQTARFGLFSIREQLEYLGGHLEIESEPGQGTTATVVVPLRDKAIV